MIDFPQKLFGEIILFIAKFDCFKKWTISDINRLFIPPIKNKQFKIWRNTNNKIIGFTTWAFFSKEVSEGYISGKRKIRPEDWDSGSILWIIDFASTSKDVKEMILYLHNKFPDRQAYHMRVKIEKKYSRRLKGKYGKPIKKSICG